MCTLTTERKCAQSLGDTHTCCPGWIGAQAGWVLRGNRWSPVAEDFGAVVIMSSNLGLGNRCACQPCRKWEHSAILKRGPRPTAVASDTVPGGGWEGSRGRVQPHGRPSGHCLRRQPLLMSPVKTRSKEQRNQKREPFRVKAGDEEDWAPEKWREDELVHAGSTFRVDI